jgi:hypothetical protein
MSRGKVYIKTATPNDHIVIPNIRTAIRQKFAAGAWTDLRIGFFLSITRAANDDDPTTLSETISSVPGPYDCYWLGLKSDGEAFPFAGATSFIGFTNAHAFAPPSWHGGDGKLVSSDIAVGTDNAYYWRPTASGLNFCGLMVVQGFQSKVSENAGWEQHFVQDPSNAGGYCTALGFRLKRNNPSSNMITVDVIANDVHSCDMAFSIAPTDDALLSLLETWSGTVRTTATISMSSLPDSFFFYWPFHSSRLRIHSRGFLRSR